MGVDRGRRGPAQRLQRRDHHDRGPVEQPRNPLHAPASCLPHPSMTPPEPLKRHHRGMAVPRVDCEASAPTTQASSASARPDHVEAMTIGGDAQQPARRHLQPPGDDGVLQRAHVRAGPCTRSIKEGLAAAPPWPTSCVAAQRRRATGPCEWPSGSAPGLPTRFRCDIVSLAVSSAVLTRGSRAVRQMRPDRVRCQPVANGAGEGLPRSLPTPRSPGFEPHPASFPPPS